MRIARKYIVRPEGGQYFHVMSRVVDKRQIFTDEEKDRFVAVMKQVERFSGVEVLTYCVMGNHFHLLIWIPRKRDISEIGDDEVFRRMEYIYPAIKVEAEKLKYQELAEGGMPDAAEEFLNRYRLRMFNMTSFMKDVKQRFTQRYNQLKDRKGNLWEERFKSVLIEGEYKLIRRFAAYIDLNPVRAGLVDKASQYQWSGFGEYHRGVDRTMRTLRFFLIGQKQSGGGVNQFINDYGEYLSFCTKSQKSGKKAGHNPGAKLRKGDSKAEANPESTCELPSTNDKDRVIEKALTKGKILGSLGFLKWALSGETELGRQWEKFWKNLPDLEQKRLNIQDRDMKELFSLCKSRKDVNS